MIRSSNDSKGIREIAYWCELSFYYYELTFDVAKVNTRTLLTFAVSPR
ncbi:hypothetical protein GGQ92_001989 [Gracilibacillus halotolerans]|uniref:Uncharacterized protein n=1 Tax=Gracilibacillus halotolerans TaxID=74386 RepID=A0A841RPT2_9BACI|nr:hypothetical protein [Gracilibacillus halotolerans]